MAKYVFQIAPTHGFRGDLSQVSEENNLIPGVDRWDLKQMRCHITNEMYYTDKRNRADDKPSNKILDYSYSDTDNDALAWMLKAPSVPIINTSATSVTGGGYEGEPDRSWTGFITENNIPADTVRAESWYNGFTTGEYSFYKGRLQPGDEIYFITSHKLPYLMVSSDPAARWSQPILASGANNYYEDSTGTGRVGSRAKPVGSNAEIDDHLNTTDNSLALAGWYNPKSYDYRFAQMQKDAVNAGTTPPFGQVDDYAEQQWYSSNQDRYSLASQIRSGYNESSAQWLREPLYSHPYSNLTYAYKQVSEVRYQIRVHPPRYRGVEGSVYEDGIKNQFIYKGAATDPNVANPSQSLNTDSIPNSGRYYFDSGARHYPKENVKYTIPGPGLPDRWKDTGSLSQIADNAYEDYEYGSDCTISIDIRAIMNRYYEDREIRRTHTLITGHTGTPSYDILDTALDALYDTVEGNDYRYGTGNRPDDTDRGGDVGTDFNWNSGNWSGLNFSPKNNDRTYQWRSSSYGSYTTYPMTLNKLLQPIKTRLLQINHNGISYDDGQWYRSHSYRGFNPPADPFTMAQVEESVRAPYFDDQQIVDPTITGFSDLRSKNIRVEAVDQMSSIYMRGPRKHTYSISEKTKRIPSIGPVEWENNVAKLLTDDKETTFQSNRAASFNEPEQRKILAEKDNPNAYADNAERDLGSYSGQYSARRASPTVIEHSPVFYGGTYYPHFQSTEGGANIWIYNDGPGWYSDTEYEAEGPVKHRVGFNNDPASSYGPVKNKISFDYTASSVEYMQPFPSRVNELPQDWYEVNTWPAMNKSIETWSGNYDPSRSNIPDFIVSDFHRRALPAGVRDNSADDSYYGGANVDNLDSNNLNIVINGYNVDTRDSGLANSGSSDDWSKTSQTVELLDGSTIGRPAIGDNDPDGLRSNSSSNWPEIKGATYSASYLKGQNSYPYGRRDFTELGETDAYRLGAINSLVDITFNIDCNHNNLSIGDTVSLNSDLWKWDFNSPRCQETDAIVDSNRFATIVVRGVPAKTSFHFQLSHSPLGGPGAGGFDPIEVMPVFLGSGGSDCSQAGLANLLNQDGTEWVLPSGFTMSSGTIAYDGSNTIYNKARDRLSALIVGHEYEVSFDVTAISGSSIIVAAHDQDGTVTASLGEVIASSTGSYNFTFTAETTQDYIVVQNNNASQTFTISDLSVYRTKGPFDEYTESEMPSWDGYYPPGRAHSVDTTTVIQARRYDPESPVTSFAWGQCGSAGDAQVIPFIDDAVVDVTISITNIPTNYTFETVLTQLYVVSNLWDWDQNHQRSLDTVTVVDRPTGNVGTCNIVIRNVPANTNFQYQIRTPDATSPQNKEPLPDSGCEQHVILATLPGSQSSEQVRQYLFENPATTFSYGNCAQEIDEAQDFSSQVVPEFNLYGPYWDNYKPTNTLSNTTDHFNPETDNRWLTWVEPGAYNHGFSDNPDQIDGITPQYRYAPGTLLAKVGTARDEHGPNSTENKNIYINPITNEPLSDTENIVQRLDGKGYWRETEGGQYINTRSIDGTYSGISQNTLFHYKQNVKHEEGMKKLRIRAKVGNTIKLTFRYQTALKRPGSETINYYTGEFPGVSFGTVYLIARFTGDNNSVQFSDTILKQAGSNINLFYSDMEFGDNAPSTMVDSTAIGDTILAMWDQNTAVSTDGQNVQVSTNINVTNAMAGQTLEIFIQEGLEGDENVETTPAGTPFNGTSAVKTGFKLKIDKAYHT